MAMNAFTGSSGSEKHLILGAQLRKARETVEFSAQEAARRLEVEPEEILDWEADRTRPSLRQLESLADLYGRDIDYFLKETPALPDKVQFRSVTRRSFIELSEEARVVIATFDELCRTAYEIEQLLGKTQPTRIGRVSQDISPVDLARQQRIDFGFDEKPVTLAKFRERLAQRGVRVFELSIPEGQFSGFSYWHPHYGPCILINADELQGRRNFTLAHEYAHLLYGHGPSVCDISEGERQAVSGDERSADIFTVEFLFPAEPLRKDFSKRGLTGRPSMQDISKIKGKWNVSVQAMLYRLENLGLIERGYANYLLTSYRPQPPRFRRGRVPRWQTKLGNVYVSNAIEAYRYGHISLGKLAHSLGLPLRKALDAVETYGEDR